MNEKNWEWDLGQKKILKKKSEKLQNICFPAFEFIFMLEIRENEFVIIVKTANQVDTLEDICCACKSPA